MTIKPALQKMFKGVLHTEEENKYNHENMGKINTTRWKISNISKITK
jgi:hypothetical protein